MFSSIPYLLSFGIILKQISHIMVYHTQISHSLISHFFMCVSLYILIRMTVVPVNESPVYWLSESCKHCQWSSFLFLFFIPFCGNIFSKMFSLKAKQLKELNSKNPAGKTETVEHPCITWVMRKWNSSRWSALLPRQDSFITAIFQNDPCFLHTFCWRHCGAGWINGRQLSNLNHDIRERWSG